MKHDISDQELIDLAKKIREKAYAPYSNFKVGAALLGKSGKIYTACNVENTTPAASICAERAAVTKAISEGEKEFVKIAVVADYAEPCPPCGICRQELYEFSKDIEIIMANTKGKFKKVNIKDLLPLAFGNYRKK